ncbi:unnamed protein product [Aspergillus oryzae]|nr:unnamed protein product [Aspergillus oryzae]
MSSHPARNVLQPTGTTLPLELELEEDIEKEIHHFVQLTRMGHYTDAQKFFDNTLGKHDHLFPVVAEYADMLLEQGRYRHAAEFLNEHIRAKEEIFDPDEMQLLKIMKALAEIYSKGALRSALVEAKRAWSLLDLEGKQRLEDLNEIYINIIVFGSRTSQWVDESWMRCPLLRSTTKSENGFVQWFGILKEGGLLWEASRIMRALLPIMPSLPAGDLEELFDITWDDSIGLSVAEQWASLMMILHQAHFLLDAALLAGLLGDSRHAVNQIYAVGRARLEVAEQNWNMLPIDHDVVPSNLHLALETVSFETARCCLSSRSADSDLLYALSILLSEANLHHDLRNQTLARLYILLSNEQSAMDWRDLYSILELQAVDCGNVVDYVHIWDLFTAWALHSEGLSRYPLGSDRFTLLLSQKASRPFPGPEWINLLQDRNPFSQPFILLGPSSKESLAFDPSLHDYPLRFDIPFYGFSPSLFHQQRSLWTSEETEASIHVVKTLIGHLNAMKIVHPDEGEHNQVLYSEPLKQSRITIQRNKLLTLSDYFAGDIEARYLADQTNEGKHNAASLALLSLEDNDEQTLMSEDSDTLTSKVSLEDPSDSPISTFKVASDFPAMPAYVFPNDEKESVRLNMQHHMFKLVNNGRLYFAPLQDPRKMLDIGTGTGIWPIEMAALFPNAEITGTDLSPIQPTVVPENVHFLVDDAAEEEWLWHHDYFDYIRLAHLTGGIPSSEELLRKSLQHLKPGGWLECHEMDPKPMCDDGTMPPEAEEGGLSAFALHDWWRAQHQSGHFTNPPRQFRIAPRIERSMIESGFVDIQQRIKKVPTNPWPSDPEMKEIGFHSERNWLEALSGWSYKPLTSLGWTRPEIEVFLVNVRKAIRNRDVHCYTNYHVVIGRKPFPDEKEAL